MNVLSLVALASLAVPPPQEADGDPKSGLAAIDKRSVEAHLRYLASPTLEGRDSPSLGLMLAAEHVAGVFSEGGLVPAPDSGEAWASVTGDLPGLEEQEGPPGWSVPEGSEGTYLRPFSTERLGRARGQLQRPIPSRCRLSLTVGSKEPELMVYGDDFVPIPGQGGSPRGELVWAGFGIQSRKQRYDSIGRNDVRGKMVMILSGDPRKNKNFGGPDETAEASLWNKLNVLDRAGAAGVIVVRRSPIEPDWVKGDVEPAPLGFRYTWASWNPPSSDRNRNARVPAIEVSEECASRLLGKDVTSLARGLDNASSHKKQTVKGRTVARTATDADPDVVHVRPDDHILINKVWVTAW